MKNIGLSLLIIGLLSGCSDANQNKKIEKTVEKEAKIDKTASPENFKRVLNDYYGRNCISIDLDAELPMNVRKNSIGSVEQKYLDLEKLGLIKLSDAHFDENADKIGQTNALGDPYKVNMVDGKKIVLTQKGKEIYKVIPKDQRRSYKQAEFCLANYEIVSITNYTKPQSMGPLTMSRVSYTAKPVNVVAFVDDISKTKSFQYYKDKTTKEISKSIDLILTEMKGWVHHNEFK